MKKFDAVMMMRAIRDELSRKLMTMSHEEQRYYIENQLERSESMAAESSGDGD